MYRKAETPQQKLIKIVHEIGIAKVEEIISVLYLYDSGKAKSIFDGTRTGGLTKKAILDGVQSVTEAK